MPPSRSHQLPRLLEGVAVNGELLHRRCCKFFLITMPTPMKVKHGLCFRPLNNFYCLLSEKIIQTAGWKPDMAREGNTTRPPPAHLPSGSISAGMPLQAHVPVDVIQE